MTRFLLSAAAAATVLAAVPAAAATYVVPLGTVSVPPASSQSPGQPVNAGAADIFYQFTLGATSPNTLVGGSFTSNGTGRVVFSSVGLYTGTLSTVPAAGASAIVFNTGQVDRFGSNTTGFDQQTLANGSYTIVLRGTASGTTSVGSSVSFEPSVVAVPEPATWGLMLLGFGMVGTGLRARRKTSVRFA